jgi:hypothetical protein
MGPYNVMFFLFFSGTYQYKRISPKEQNCMMEEKARLFSCKDVELFGQAEVLEVLSESVGVEHGKGIVDHVPCWDVDKRQQYGRPEEISRRYM